MHSFLRGLAFGALWVATGALADLGDPDPTWGTEGVVQLTPPCNLYCNLNIGAVARQGSNTLVLANFAGQDPFGNFGVALVLLRFLPSGAADATFGNNGRVTLFSSGQAAPQIFTQPDGRMAFDGSGRILVAGRSNVCSAPGSCTTSIGLARLSPDGALDSAFGAGGRIQGTVPVDRAVGLAVQPDGKILVAASSPKGALFRFDSSGPDPAFGSGGYAALNLPADPNPFLRWGSGSLADGRMVVARYGYGNLVEAVRVTASGAPDPAFNGTGSIAMTPSFLTAAMTTTPDGGVFFGGNNPSGPAAGAVLRIAPNGTIDVAWGQGGSRAFGDGFDLETLGTRDDGRLVAGGNAAGRYAFRRWMPNGDSDGSLRGQGYAVSNLPEVADANPGVLLPFATQAVVGDGGGRVTLFGGARNVLANDGEFVAQQFRDFLGRAGDPGGIDYWRGRLAGGMTRGELVEAFLGSPEFEARVAPIVRLYLAYFLRYPDFPGLLYWVGLFGSGTPLNAISQSFAGSPEFAQRYGSLDNDGFVRRVYENVLGRQPDAGGLAYWRGTLDSGSMTRGQVMLAFSESAEYRGLAGNEVFVTMIYAGMLRREPDAGGFLFWVGQLDAGFPPRSLCQAMAEAAEYAQRFAQ